MAIDLKLIDELLADYKKPEDITGEHGLLKQLTKALRVDLGRGGAAICGKHAGEREPTDAVAGSAQKFSARK
jgi:putative transposase